MVQRSDTNQSRYRELALDSNKVQICQDRGLGSYDRNRLIIQPSSDNSIWDASSNLDIVTQIRDQLYKKTLDTSINDVSASFVPLSDTMDIIPFDALRSVIKALPQCNNLSIADKQQLAYEIWNGGGNRCQNPCLRLLAALIASEKVDRFMSCIDDGITDDCIPFQNNPSINGRLRCRHSDHTHKSLDLNRNAMMSIITWSNAFVSPYFEAPKGVHMHYVLDKGTVLPIIRNRDVHQSTVPAVQKSSDENQGFSVGHGAFGVVTRVQFHESHIKFECCHVSRCLEGLKSSLLTVNRMKAKGMIMPLKN
jgi:hypothetical protein